jgi:D-serine deaminase-like pyridoxal phosphate-dependent protein
VQAGSTIGILVDFDIGTHRTGLQTPQETLALAQHVSRTRGLRLDGLFCYAGHVVDTEPDAMIAKLKAIDAQLHSVLDLWKQHGLKADIVSGGSTPTAMQSHHVTAYTEIRPGTYVYNDVNYTGGGWNTTPQCAARVVCTVVSNAVPGKCVIDAGGKALTYDRYFIKPDSGFGRVVEYPDTTIVRLSEEHGEIKAGPSGKLPRLGERVSVIPNHVCPCVNLHPRAWLKHADDTVAPLEIEARGLLS